MICDHTLPKCLFGAVHVCCQFINNKRPSKPLPNQSRYQNADMNLFVTVFRPEWDAPPVSPIHNPIFSGPFWNLYHVNQSKADCSMILIGTPSFHRKWVLWNFSRLLWNFLVCRETFSEVPLALKWLRHFRKWHFWIKTLPLYMYLIKTLSYSFLNRCSRNFKITTKCWVHYLWINIGILFGLQGQFFYLSTCKKLIEAPSWPWPSG